MQAHASPDLNKRIPPFEHGIPARTCAQEHEQTCNIRYIALLSKNASRLAPPASWAADITKS